MVLEREISDVLRTQLLTGAYEVHFENAPDRPDLPCVVYGQTVLPPTRTGQEPFFEHSGFLNFNVLTESKTYATQGEDIAETLSALFPADKKFSLTGGSLRLVSTPHIQRGFDDGAYWSVPVSVPYLAHKD